MYRSRHPSHLAIAAPGRLPSPSFVASAQATLTPGRPARSRLAWLATCPGASRFSPERGRSAGGSEGSRCEAAPDGRSQGVVLLRRAGSRGRQRRRWAFLSRLRRAAEGGDEESGLARGVRREELDDLVVVEGETGGAESLRVRGEVQATTHETGLEIARAVAAVAEGGEEPREIREEEHGGARRPAEGLVEAEERGGAADVAGP